MKGYLGAISDATGVTDEGTLRELEEIMRQDIFHSTLDWQGRDLFDEGARMALEVFNELQKPSTEA